MQDSSFEAQNGLIYDACRGIYNDSFTKYLKFWNRPTDGTPDLYSYNYISDGLLKPPLFDPLKFALCDPSYNTGFKRFYILPRTGNSFAGCWFVKVRSSGLNYPYYREFIQTELSQPLTVNCKYRIGFSYISNPMTSQKRNLDLLFTDSKIQNKNVHNCYTFPHCTGFKQKYMPQVSFSNLEPFVRDTGIWHLKDTVFKNKTAGLKWLTIGSFTDTLFGAEVRGQEGAYYFLDDVFVYEIPGIIAPDTVCMGSWVEITSNLKGPWTWLHDGNILSRDSIYGFYATKSGWYYLKTPNEADSFFLSVDSSVFFNLGNDTFLCGEGTRIKKTIDIPMAHIKWQDNSKDSVYLIETSGQYFATATKDACSYSDTINVDKRPEPPLSILSREEFCSEDSLYVLLKLDSQYKYFWPYSGVSNSVVKIEKKGEYEVHIDGGNGCSNRGAIRIDDICGPSIWIPSAFTPTGMNPVFKPIGVNIKSYTLAIYNRWGEQLLQMTGKEVQWDGRFMDELCMQGIYVYTLVYTGINQRTYFEKGTIELMQ